MKRTFDELLFLKDELERKLTEDYSVTIFRDAAVLYVCRKYNSIFSGIIIQRIVELCSFYQLDFFFSIEKGCMVIY